MCFVHAFLPSDFFVYLVEFLLPSSGYGRYQSQFEVSYTSFPGPPLWKFPPLRSLRWPRLVPRLFGLLLSGGGSGRPDPLRLPGGSGRRTSYSQTSVRRYLDAKSCGPAISGSLKPTENCRIHLKNVLLSRTTLLGSPEPACSPAGLMV